MVSSTTPNHRDPFLAKLVDFSLRATASPPPRHWRHFLPSESEDIIPTGFSAVIMSAEPLSGLKERDNKALAELFEREDVEDINADIMGCLSFLYPAPCWEDDPFDFLEGYV